MGNDKTVAERLREINDYNSTVGCELFNMLNGTRDCTDWTCKGCRKATYTALADMIEAEQAKLRKQSGVDVDALLSLADYFERMGNDTFAWTRVTAADPHRWKGTIRDAVKGANASKPTPLPEGVEWPRFEDGELVKLGDEFEFDGIKHSADMIRFQVYSGESEPTTTLLDFEWVPVGYKSGTRVKRPEPEVLDMDGEPIRVGDTVYANGYPDPLEVRGYTDEAVWCRAEGDKENNPFGSYELTHRKPDTQEAINDDATMPHYTYCSKVLKIEEAQTTEEMVTAMAQDLLARQRKLLGGE